MVENGPVRLVVEHELKYAAPWPFGPVAGHPRRGVRCWIELANVGLAVTLASECSYAAFKSPTAQGDSESLIQPLLPRTVRSCGDANLYYAGKWTHRSRFTVQPQGDPAWLGEEQDCGLEMAL